MFSFPEACQGGGIDVGVETVESSVFFSNVLADIFNGESVWE